MANRVCEVFSNREESYHTYCYKCLTCGEGMPRIPFMCETCRDTCHAGHNTQTEYYNYFVCGCGNGEYPGQCQAMGTATKEEENKPEVKIETKEGWLEEQGLDLEKWAWTKRYFILFPDRLEIHEKQPEEKKDKPMASWPYDKLRLIDRFPKSPKFDVYSATGAIEVQAPSPAEKKEWLRWVAARKKGVARTLKTIAIQTTKKDDEASANAQGGKAASEAKAKREKQAEITRKLPIWKHPAFIGHFCDVSFPSVTLEKMFDEDEVFLVQQCIETLMRTVEHASSSRRADLSTFDDAQVKNLAKVGLFLTKLKTTYSELQMINWKTQFGMSKFLLKFTKSIKAMKPGEAFPFMHPNHKNVIFIAERLEKSFTFVICTLDTNLLAYHPFSLDEYPKVKYQNCLRISDIGIDKFLDTSTWALLFCYKQIDRVLIYEILVPFFMEGRVFEDGKLQGEDVEVKKRLDFYQTQPRSEKYGFYRSLLAVLRYFVRSMGISHLQAKQLFYGDH